MILNKERIISLAQQGLRIDGRALTQYRGPIEIKTGISWTAEGSSEVRLGETVVMAGVKLSIEKPYNDTPDEGGIMVNVELLPLSNAEYQPGPPGIDAIELARVIDRGIREAKSIDLKQLCIEAGEKAWFVSIDIITINDKGNLFDVAGLAVLAALKSARFPVVDPETGAINYKEKTDRVLPLVREAIPVTVHKINQHLLIDPTKEEEKVTQARLTVTTDSLGVISALQKGGEMPITIKEVKEMVELATDKANFLREQLRQVKL